MATIRPESMQKGASLLITMLILLLFSSTAFILSRNTSVVKMEQQDKTRTSLLRAKEALIAYAVTHYEIVPGEFGVLPCPDYTNSATLEGEQDSNCGSTDANAVGRLPWRTLDLGPIKDSNSECLWYAVSGPYKKRPERTFLNSDTPGLLKLYANDGVTPLPNDSIDSRPVAAVFAPGLPIGQNRIDLPATDVPNCGGSYDAFRYLEAVGLADNAVFDDTAFTIDEIAQGPFTNETVINDQVVYITRDEIWNAILARSDYLDKLKLLTEQIAECIAEYGRNNSDFQFRLPWAAPIGPFAGNDGYYDDTNYDDTSALYGGRIPFTIDDSINETGSTFPFPPSLLFTATISPCDQLNSAAVAADDELIALWNNWKDHLFYAVSQARSPASPPGSDCSLQPCLTVNGTDECSAVVIFSNTTLTLTVPSQTRTGPPDPDTRDQLTNYLEDNNTILETDDGDGDYSYRAADDTFNDIIYCIKEDLTVCEYPDCIFP